MSEESGLFLVFFNDGTIELFSEKSLNDYRNNPQESEEIEEAIPLAPPYITESQQAVIEKLFALADVLSSGGELLLQESIEVILSIVSIRQRGG